MTLFRRAWGLRDWNLKGRKILPCRQLRYWCIVLVSCLLWVNVLPALAILPSDVEVADSALTHSAMERLTLPSTQPLSAQLSAEPMMLVNSDSVRDSLNRGKRFYDAGRLSEAAQTWQKAAEQFARQEQPMAQATALRYVAIAQQDLADLASAQIAITQALMLAESLQQPLLLAQTLNTQGSIQLRRGEAQQAYSSYQRAEQYYSSMGDLPGIQLSQLNQVQALQALGFYRRARALLGDLEQSLNLHASLNSSPAAVENQTSESTAVERGLSSRTTLHRRVSRETKRTAVREEAPGGEASELEALGEDDSVADRPDMRLTDSYFRAQTLRSLAQVLRTVGDQPEAEVALAQSLIYFTQLEATTEIPPTVLLQGDLAQDQGQYAKALALYDQARAIAEDLQNTPMLLDVDLRRLRLLIETRELASANRLSHQLLEQLNAFPPSRWSLEAGINLAESLRLLEDPVSAQALLTGALDQAHALGDLWAESYLLGQQGHLAESQGNWAEALASTRLARQKAGSLQADEIAVSWLWQEGRLLKALGQPEAAITAYSQAVSLLKTLRQDLVAMNPAVQFSFRDQVEPIYRQLVSLLLENVDQLPSPVKQARLEQSRQTLEALQLAQVQNFLREACDIYEAQPIEKIDPTAAVFYPIVLDDRLEVILSLPGQPLQHYGSALSDAEQQRWVREIRQSLNPAFPPESGFLAEQQLYDRLIRPGEAWLERQGIQTLVFVLDDFLRNLPMAVLRDGDRYLIEKYSLALTPGLQLFESQPLMADRLKILGGGLTESRQGFAPLPAVEQEFQSVVQQTKGLAKATVLLDQKFTRDQFVAQMKNQPFSVLHLATHGQFSSNAEDTFLLAWDGRIGVQDLNQWLSPASAVSGSRAGFSAHRFLGHHRSPIDLLILSACQTAKGDRRAALGLAGLAVRSGTRSTLATLWSVQDHSTAGFMELFYGQLLNQGASRAEALRWAQLQLLQGLYDHPYYWAPFVLVGNWQ